MCRGIRSGCCWVRPSRGCRSWCRSGMGGCWSRRSRSTGALRCRWRRILPNTPASGLRVQLCGDAHLSNFGAFASPERRLVFDVNDFDETLPGPFEWDVKRLAASLSVAGRDNRFGGKDRRKIVLAGAEAYRTAMRGFAQQPLLDVWYAHLDIEDAIGQFRSKIDAKRFKASEKLLAKARTRDSMQALGKLTTVIDGRRQIISDPNPIVPLEELFSDVQADALYEEIRGRVGQVPAQPAIGPAAPARTVHADPSRAQGRRRRQRRHSRPDPTDGRRRRGRTAVPAGQKEPQPSVLAEYCGRSQYTNEGERVVAGQHLLQAQSDIFLGWTHITGPDGVDRDFYMRQLRDWKFSVPIEQMLPVGLTAYAQLCGWTLARGTRPFRRPRRPGGLPRRLHQIRPGHRRVRRNLRRPERT